MFYLWWPLKLHSFQFGLLKVVTFLNYQNYLYQNYVLAKLRFSIQKSKLFKKRKILRTINNTWGKNCSILSHHINQRFSFCMIMVFANCQFLWQPKKVYLDANLMGQAMSINMLNMKSALSRSISLVILLFLVWDIKLSSQTNSLKTEILHYPYSAYLTSLGKKQYIKLLWLRCFCIWPLNCDIRLRSLRSFNISYWKIRSHTKITARWFQLTTIRF